MQKRESDTPERSKYDTFMTHHGKVLGEVKDKVTGLVHDLLLSNITVFRYKIEDTVLDSRNSDVLGLLS